MKKELTIRDKAEQYIKLTAEIKEKSEALETLKNELFKESVSEMFPELKLKVVIVEGSEKNHIDIAGVFKDLVKRKDDFLSVISITQASLKKLADGEILIAKHKVIDGKGDSSVKIVKMTKEELK